MTARTRNARLSPNHFSLNDPKQTVELLLDGSWKNSWPDAAQVEVQLLELDEQTLEDFATTR